jgi:soluble lytic murein transglycosylase-like protein
MKQRLHRLILFAALALEGVGVARAAPPKHPPLPKARPAFPDDPPPADPNAPQMEGVSQQAAYQATAPDPSRAIQYAPAQSQSVGPFGALFAPSQPAPAAFSPPPEQPPPESIAAQPSPAAGPADYPQPPVDLPSEAQDEVEGFAIAEKSGLAGLTRKYARQHGIPLALLHRIIMRESKYCPRLVHRRYYGLMQITPATARSMGYHGSAKGLLNPETNLAYAAPYLANAWALADGDMDRAVRLYASGYYYTAKNKHMLDQMRDANSPPVETIAAVSPAPPPQRAANVFDAMFGSSSR